MPDTVGTFTFTEWDFFERKDQKKPPEYTLRIHVNGGPADFVADRAAFAGLAHKMRQVIEPTPEDQILAALQRIEGLLKKT